MKKIKIAKTKCFFYKNKMCSILPTKLLKCNPTDLCKCGIDFNKVFLENKSKLSIDEEKEYNAAIIAALKQAGITVV
jgi:hypothetical protein